MTWDSGIRFDLRILRFFRGPGDLDSSRDVSPRAESHFSAVWNPRSPKKVLTSIDPGSDDCILGFGGTAQGFVYGLFYNNHGSGKWPFGD